MPEGAKLLPGSTVLESQPRGFYLNRPRETPIAESQPVRTRREKSIGKTFLYLGGKTFQQIAAPEATAVPATKEGIASREIKVKKGSQAAALLGDAGDFVTVEPFTGVQLDLPGDWQTLDPSATEKVMTSAAAIVGKQLGMKMNTTWGFFPPGDVTDVYITLGIQPVSFSFTPQEMSTLTQTDIDRFSKGFVNNGSRILESKGYRLKPGVKSERVKISERQAISCQAEAETPSGSFLIMQSLLIPTETAAVMVSFIWIETPGNPWKPIMERARSSLRVADTITVATPAP